MPSSTPRDFAAVGDTLFFTASDGIHGRELWKSDGTEAGTVLVKNIKPDSARRPGSFPGNLTVVRDTLFFTANDGTHGHELWKSDGTEAGTVLVKNINPTDSGSFSYYSSLKAVGGRLFFTADDGTRGEELWKSDGTRTGTVLVKNITPKGAEDYSYGPASLTAMGGRLFFAADDGAHGVELWKSDGTRTGTVLVKNIDPIERDDAPHYPTSYPSSLTVIGGRLFFAADDGTRGEELWRSDGSRGGTVLLKDINPGGRNSDSDPYSLTAVEGRLFFVAVDGTRGEELWSSDGTRAGTVLVKNINPTDSGSFSYFPSLKAVGGRLFFAADDGTRGEELWRSDGRRAGTVLVKNIAPVDDGPDYSGSYPSSLTAMGGGLFFAADDGTHGPELWKSDGSAAGTVMVKNIDLCDEPGSEPASPPSSLTAMGGSLFFAANDGTHGEELWKSDGTAEGTALVKDIHTGTAP